MSIGVGFTVFSGIDLLKPSIENIRDISDFVTVGYQKISNTGKKCHPYMMDLLSDLSKDHLIDNKFEYVPNLNNITPKNVQKNNVSKRNLIRLSNLNNKIDYFICKDCDEFYEKEQFKKAFFLIKKNNYDCTLSKLREYKYKPIYQNKGLSGTYVPFIQKSNVPFDISVKMKYRVDPARRFKGVNFHFFEPKDLLMHHMTQVRFNDSEMEYKYSSHSWFNKKDYIKNSMSHYKNIDLNEFNILDKDIFNIEDYWRGDFCKYLDIQ